MPGRRNLKRELAQHDAGARFAECFAMLRTQLPDHDRALLGWDAILGYLHDPLMLRRLNGRPLTYRMVRRWRRVAGFPILRGNRHPSIRWSPLSTSQAVTAWVLTQFAVGRIAGFGVAVPRRAGQKGKRPTEQLARLAA